MDRLCLIRIIQKIVTLADLWLDNWKVDIKLTHEKVNTTFKSAEIRKLMHDLVDHENDPKVRANNERFHQASVRFFWRFYFPMLSLFIAMTASVDWWAIYKVDILGDNAVINIAFQLAFVFGFVLMTYPKR